MASSGFKKMMSRFEVDLVPPEGTSWLKHQIEISQPNMMVTLAFNQPTISHEYARRVLAKFFENLDRKLSGKYYWERPDDRIQGWAIPEKWESNPHFHCALRIPLYAINKFPYRAEKFWRGKTSKTIDIQKIYNLHGAIEYITKSANDPRHFENVLQLNELWRRK